MTFEEYLLRVFFDMFTELEGLEHWSIEGLEIIPRSLVLKTIKKYKEMIK